MIWRFLTTIQWRILQLAARLPFFARRPFPLFFPFTYLHHLGVLPSWVYEEVFVNQCYGGWGTERGFREIVDIGGNIGLSSLYFLNRYPDAHITTIEANPATIEQLKQNLKTFTNVTIKPVAVAANNGEVDFWIDRSSASLLNASITGRDVWTGHEFDTIKVKAVSLPEVLPDHVDLLKMDIEGAEYDVLPADCVRPSRIERIVLEAHDLDRRRAEYIALRDMLVDRGYRCLDPEPAEPWPTCRVVRFAAAT